MSFRMPRRQEMYYEEPEVEEEVVVQDDEDVEEIPSPLNFHHKMIGLLTSLCQKYQKAPFCRTHGTFLAKVAKNKKDRSSLDLVRMWSFISRYW